MSFRVVLDDLDVSKVELQHAQITSSGLSGLTQYYLQVNSARIPLINELEH